MNAFVTLIYADASLSSHHSAQIRQVQCQSPKRAGLARYTQQRSGNIHGTIFSHSRISFCSGAITVFVSVYILDLNVIATA